MTAPAPTIYMTVAEMADRYVERLSRHASPSYLYAVRRALWSQLVKYYGSIGINDFTISEASATINRMRCVPLSNSMIYTYCSLLRAAFESERRNGRLYDNPWNHVHFPRREYPDKRALDDVEIALLEEAFSHNALGNYFGFIMHTGLKRAEAAGVLTGSWDQRRHQLTISSYIDYSQKGRNKLICEAPNAVRRTIPLSPEAEHCLDSALEQQRNLRQTPSSRETTSALVFTNLAGKPLDKADISFNAKVIQHLTGIDDFSATLLRDSFIVTQLREGTSVHLLQTYLGMRSRQTVLRYASLRSSGTQQAADVMEGFFDEMSNSSEGFDW